MRSYNAAYDLIQPNLDAGRADKLAFVDDRGRCTFGELASKVSRFAGALRAAGIAPEQRALLCLEDSIAFPIAFLGAIWAGVVPVPVNTLLNTADYATLLRHSRARIVFVSRAQLDLIGPAVSPGVVLVVCDDDGLAQFLETGRLLRDPYDSTPGDLCFWLYSSGSTGEPKAVVHVHSSLRYTAEHYARRVLGLGQDDVVYSASKLFFAYGLGNALTFPLSAGATTVLTRRRVTPDVAFERLVAGRATIFCGVPTLYANMLARPDAPAPDQLAVRRCVSAGEALPRDIGERWTARYGSEILDGIGSTEMLHIFLSNRPGEVRYGTTGQPVPGYEMKLVGDDGREVTTGELGDLYVRGASRAAMYWADHDRSCATFQGEWTRTGDKFLRDAEGAYVYGGRSDDMLKVGGLYVSPFEVESALIGHPDVLEAAVVGATDEFGLVKPRAFVVLRHHAEESAWAAQCEALRTHVKTRLAHYKCPHWIEFVAELPKTATGKVQRFRLRS